MPARTDLPLLLIDIASRSNASGKITGRTRLMKLAFLAQMETPGAVAELVGTAEPYHFSKYLYGPFSSELLSDLDSLSLQNFIVQRSIPLDQEGKVIRWEYSLTDRGAERVRNFIGTRPVQELGALVAKYQGSSTRELLRYVYTKYLRGDESTLVEGPVP